MRAVLLALAAAGLVAVAISAAPAADWPQFLGPDRSGVSPETGLSRSWPEGGPKVLWQIPMNAGFGGPAIEKGKVYIMDRVKDKEDILHCLNLADGNEVWSLSYEAPGKIDFEGPRATPTVDEKHVFIVGPLGHVYCIDKATGKEVWHKSLTADFGMVAPHWSVAQSPVLYKNTVILAPQSPKAGLVALDKDTGNTVWTSAEIGKPAYASALLATVAGVEQVVMLASLGDEASHATDSNDHPVQLTGLDPADGKILWTFTDWKCKYPIPSATAMGDGVFFLTGGYKGGCCALKVTKEGDKFTAAKLYANMNCGCKLHNPVLYKGKLYANSSDTKGGLMCLDPASGNILWQTAGKPDFEMGAVLVADGLIFAVEGGKKGILHLVEASPDAYKELAEAKVLEAKGGQVWAPMALSEGKLLLRDLNQLKCLEVGGK